MITLFTRNGRETGNAIIYGSDTSKFLEEPVFLVETDFGNRMRLTAKEIDDSFMIGRPQDYATWAKDRRALQNRTWVEDNQPEPEPGVCNHDWQYQGTDYHGSHKGEDSYSCSKCYAREYRQ